jgi:thiosulfate/3-mercaptopyruvate sulfurtransferase
MNGYAKPDALVETSWLEAHLQDPAVQIIEVDEGTAGYRKGHIPGAVGWSWSSDLRTPVGRDSVDRARLERLLARATVRVGTTVVLYGGNNNWFAAYAYWLLRLRGFEYVKLLNGGKQKWVREHRPVTRVVPASWDTQVRIHGLERQEIRALRDRVLHRIGDGATFVDVRTPEEYRGERLAPEALPQERAQVGGHIPGAVNIPTATTVNDDGTFKPASELRALYEDAGVTPDREVIAYCRIGERSSHTWFALSELLGYPVVRNYDGSWTEYGSLVGVPVAR